LTVSIFLESIPYPDGNGEFVLAGNRYIFPIYLRTQKQYDGLQKKLLKKGTDTPEDATGTNGTNDSGQQEFQRKKDNHHVVLLHELLIHRIKNRLECRLKTRRDKSWKGDLGILRGALLGWFRRGDNTILHRFIHKYGQWVDRESPLNRILQRKELSFHGLGGEHPDSTRGYHIRDVDDDDIYRICPVLTPQGHRVGMRLSLARRSKVDFDKKSIMPPTEPEKGDSLSHTASLIPFIEHDDVSRAMMGANMMKQALPLEHSEVPWIQTGWEQELAASP